LNFTGQFETFIITVITGVVMGALFDFYRILRGVFRPRWMLTSLADLLYWLLSTVLVFVALLLGNWGEVRFYVFFGLFTGIVGYYKLCSRLTMRILIWLIRFVVRVVRTLKLAIAFTVIRPLGFIAGCIAKPVRYINRKIAARRPPPDQNIPPE
jgi:spore cortex biosynthesis protein YabQ